MPGVVKCDWKKTWKVPWSFHLVDVAIISHLSENWVIIAKGLRVVLESR